MCFGFYLAADQETQDYLWTMALTMGRMSEINRLTWEDVNLEQRYVVLYTRKKRGASNAEKSRWRTSCTRCCHGD